MPRTASALLHQPLHTRADLDALCASLDPVDVANVDDPIARNELITHSYWKLAEAMYARLGRESLVWPTFGAWASAQAGRYMRTGGVPAVSAATFGYGSRVTELLGTGNQLIFRHIGPVFRRFVDWLDADEPALRHRMGDPALRDLVADYLELDPRSHDESPDGEQLMVLAFEQYLRAYFEDDPEFRAERIFVANCCVGLEEQMRVDDTLDDLLYIPRLNQAARFALTPLRLAVHGVDRLSRRAAPRWREFVPTGWSNYHRLLRRLILDGKVAEVIGTQLFLEMKLGADDVNLCVDILEPEFAPGLETIDLASHDFVDSWELVQRWDPTPDSPLGSAAVDWSQLSDRMHFIIDLFRVNQHRNDLATHPMAPP